MDNESKKIQSEYSDYESGEWVHYSNFPELKINPQQFHQDPSGVYLFPENFHPASMWKLMKYKFIVSLPLPKDKVLDLSKVTKEKATEYLRKLDLSHKINDEYLNENPARHFWGILREHYGKSRAASWNKDIRTILGFDAVFDDTKAIHSNEKQLLLLNTKLIKNISREDQSDSGYSDTQKVISRISSVLSEYGEVEIEPIKKQKQWGETYLRSKVSVGDVSFQISTILPKEKSKEYAPREISVRLTGVHSREFDMSMGVTLERFDMKSGGIDFEKLDKEIAYIMGKIKESKKSTSYNHRVIESPPAELPYDSGAVISEDHQATGERLQSVHKNKKDHTLASVPPVLFHVSTRKFNRFVQQQRPGLQATDAGFHFGTKEAAMARVVQIKKDPYHSWKEGDPIYLYSVHLSVSSPLQLKENRLGSWSVSDILRKIFEEAETGTISIPEEIINDWYEDILIIDGENWIENLTYNLKEDISNLQKFLKSLGYDSISYENEYEGGGTSYIVFDSNQIEIIKVETLDEAIKKDHQATSGGWLSWEEKGPIYPNGSPALTPLGNPPYEESPVVASVYKEISFSESTESGDFGFDGYLSDNKIQLENFLNKEGLSIKVLKELNFDTFAILKNIWVDEGLRGQGLGNELLKDFLGRVEEADIVLLVSDSSQSQETGFDLKAWYESFGFEEIARSSAGPLMVLKGIKTKREVLSGFQNKIFNEGDEFTLEEIESIIEEIHAKGLNYGDPNIDTDEEGNINLFGIHKHPKYRVEIKNIADLDVDYPTGDYTKYIKNIELAPPILLNSYGEVLDGWHRLAAAKAAGLKTFLAFVPIGERIKSSLIIAAQNKPKFKKTPKLWDGKTLQPAYMSFDDKVYVIEGNECQWIKDYLDIPESNLYYMFFAHSAGEGEKQELDPPLPTEIPKEFYQMYQTAIYCRDMFFKTFKASKSFQNMILKVLTAHRDRPANLTVETVNPLRKKNITTQSFIKNGMKALAGIEEDNLNKWLGRSKIKKAVYHGTDQTFDSFDPAKRELGFHFGSSETQAKERGSKILKCFLRLENPLEVSGDLGDWSDPEMLHEYLGEANLGPFSDKEIENFKNADDYRKALQEKGYDGIIYENQFEGDPKVYYKKTGRFLESYIVFEPEQIKSADKNSGEYSPSTTNIFASELYDKSPIQRRIKSQSSGFKELAGIKDTDFPYYHVSDHSQKPSTLKTYKQELGNKRGEIEPFGIYLFPKNEPTIKSWADKKYRWDAKFKPGTKIVKLSNSLLKMVEDAKVTLLNVLRNGNKIDLDYNEGNFLYLLETLELESDLDEDSYIPTLEMYHHSPDLYKKEAGPLIKAFKEWIGDGGSHAWLSLMLHFNDSEKFSSFLKKYGDVILDDNNSIYYNEPQLIVLNPSVIEWGERENNTADPDVYKMESSKNYSDEGMVGDNWGSQASGILFKHDNKVLLLYRSGWVMDPYTWGVPGGAVPVDSDGNPMDVKESALKETEEEIGGIPSYSDTGKKTVKQKGSFKYTTFLFEVEEEFDPLLNNEHTDYGWFSIEDLPAKIHLGVKWSIDQLFGKKTESEAGEIVDDRLIKKDRLNLGEPLEEDLSPPYYGQHPMNDPVMSPALAAMYSNIIEVDVVHHGDEIESSTKTTAGISPVLYHITSLHNAVNILEEDRFNLRFAYSADDLSKPKNKLYFFSAMRVPSGGFREQGEVTLVLDGSKLSQKYKGSPVDYWGESFRKAAEESKSDPTRYDETEDRIWNTDPTIPNASSYIKEIHCVFDRTGRYAGEPIFAKHQNERLRKLSEECIKKGTPLYIYSTYKDKYLLNKAKAKKLEDFNLVDPEMTEEQKEWYQEDLSRPKRRGYYGDNDTLALVELYEYTKDQSKPLSDRAHRLWNYIYSMDRPKIINNDMRHSSPEVQKKLTDIWKKEKIKNSKEFMDFMNKRLNSIRSSVDLNLSQLIEGITKEEIKKMFAGTTSYLHYPVTLNGDPEHHITVKFFDKTPVTPEMIEEATKGISKLPPSNFDWEPVVFQGKRGEVRVLELKNLPANVSELHYALEIVRPDDYPVYRPHITVSDELWEKIKNEGLKAKDFNIEVGPLTFENKGKVEKVFSKKQIESSFNIEDKIEKAYLSVNSMLPEEMFLKPVTDCELKLYTGPRSVNHAEPIGTLSFERHGDHVLMSYIDDETLEEEIMNKLPLTSSYADWARAILREFGITESASTAILAAKKSKRVEIPDSVMPTVIDDFSMDDSKKELLNMYEGKAIRADSFEEFQELLSKVLLELQLTEDYRKSVAGILNQMRLEKELIAL